MKSVIILIIISFFFHNLFAQEKVTPSLEKAKGAFNSGDMEEARFTLVVPIFSWSFPLYFQVPNFQSFSLHPPPVTY